MKDLKLLQYLPLALATITSFYAAANVCVAQYSFMPLGTVSGEEIASVRGISADGSVVVGYFQSGETAFRWTRNNGFALLSGIDRVSTAHDVSENGLVVIGRKGAFEDQYAFRWTEVDGPISLGKLQDGAETRVANGVSTDGAVIVGSASTAALATTQAFRWTTDNGAIGLGRLRPGNSNSTAQGVSADGLVVVGSEDSISGPSNREAFRWTESGGMVGLGDLSGGPFFSFPWRTSADGSVVVGLGTTELGREAFRWTKADGMVGLGTLPGLINSIAIDVSGDGSIIVGYAYSSQSYDGDSFVWTQATGMVSIKDLLVTAGVDGLEGWRLAGLCTISADGRTIAGTGTNPTGSVELYIATIPPIPEPSTWALAACGLLCAALLLRNRRRLFRERPSGD